MAHVSAIGKMEFTVQSMEHLSLVQETELLVVLMWACDIVLGAPWCQSRKADSDWQCAQLLALQTPGGAEVVAVDRVDHQDCPGNEPVPMAREAACSEGGGGIPDIQILRAIALDDLLASE